MIQIKAPDGSIAQFPDGTGDDVIKSVMQKSFGGPSAPAAAPAAPSTISDLPPVQAVGDIARMVIRGAAMGKEATPEDAADRANALANIASRKFGRGRMPEMPVAKPEDYKPFFEGQQKEMKAAADRAGLAGNVAELGGTIATAGPIGNTVGALSKAASALPMAGRMLASPWTAAAGTGAILGASNAQGTDTGLGTGATVGAVAGLGGQAVGNALSGAVGKIAGAFSPKPIIPTADEIRAATSKAYKAADDAGVVYTPQLFQRIRDNVVNDISELGYSPKLQPKIAAVLEELGAASQGNVTLKGADVVRKIAGGAYDPGNQSSNKMMGIIKSKIDDALANEKPGDVLMGNASAGRAALEEARKNAQIGFKLNDIEKAQKIAELQTSAAGSGGNINNNTRRKIAQALLMPGKGGGLTPDEISAAQRVVSGTPTQNALRLVGKLSPSGNGLMAALHAVGAASTGGASLPLMAVGAAAKPLADRATNANIQKLVEVIRAGGSRAATEPAPNAVQRLAKSERDRLVRALMVGGVVAAPSFSK